MPKFKLDCRTCSTVQKAQRGCTQDSLIPDAWVLDGWKFSRCPLRLITQQSGQYIRAYNFYKESHLLPNPGTWQQQPLKFIKVIEFIEAAVAEADKK